MRFIFVPGGPGFSSRHEAMTLGSRLEALGWTSYFWEDPARRGGPPPSWNAHVADLAATIRGHSGDGLALAAHSFAVHPVLAAAERAGAGIEHLILIAPAFDVQDGHRRLAALAASDFDTGRVEAAARVRQLVGQSRALFDASMQEALNLASEDRGLLAHYWRNPEAFAAFATTAATVEGRFDPDAFHAVLRDMSQIAGYSPRVEIGDRTRVSVVVGDRDPIVDYHIAWNDIQGKFPDAMAHVFEDCGHWAHLEQPDRFVQVVTK